ncbi:MAG TPA: hypothetical protein VF618_17790 [Thermoanaerobaculia bacterium]
MSKRNHARALKSATANCREGRPEGARPAAAWVRSMRRAQRALDSSRRLITAALRTAAKSERSAGWLPIRSSKSLEHAEARMRVAASRLAIVSEALDEWTACVVREPESGAGAPVAMLATTTRWFQMLVALNEASGTVFSMHENVLAGLKSGALVPENEARRPLTITLTPRPTAIRPFLTVLTPRVGDRISVLLKRRRRAPRPAAVKVPRRTSQGRAPPLSSICLL